MSWPMWTPYIQVSLLTNIWQRFTSDSKGWYNFWPCNGTPIQIPYHQWFEMPLGAQCELQRFTTATQIGFTVILDSTCVPDWATGSWGLVSDLVENLALMSECLLEMNTWTNSGVIPEYPLRSWTKQGFHGPFQYASLSLTRLVRFIPDSK